MQTVDPSPKPSIESAAPADDPAAPPAAGITRYHDSPLERLMIRLFSRKMAQALGRPSQLKGYDALVDLSKQIVQGRSALSSRRWWRWCCDLWCRRRCCG